MPTVKLSLIVLSYNSLSKLPGLFTSLAAQTLPDIEYIVVDNDSKDQSVSWLKQQNHVSIQHLIENTDNAWFARGNNQAIPYCQGDIIVFCNDDLVLEPQCLAELYTTIQSATDIAVVGGKLLRPHTQPPMIDSAGLVMQRSRQVRNRGENTIDLGQYNNTEDVFGISGALMAVRRSTLERIKYQQQYFDEDFIAYKEDIDLCWRMRRAGFRIVYCPKAVAYHARSIQASTLTGRRKKSALIRKLSYRNHWWTIIKNDTARTFCRDLLWIFPYEFAKLLYLCLAEWSTLAIIPETIQGYQRMRAKHHL